MIIENLGPHFISTSPFSTFCSPSFRLISIYFHPSSILLPFTCANNGIQMNAHQHVCAHVVHSADTCSMRRGDRGRTMSAPLHCHCGGEEWNLRSQTPGVRWLYYHAGWHSCFSITRAAGGGLGVSTDVYALACIIVEVFGERPVWEAHTIIFKGCWWLIPSDQPPS